MLITSIFSLLSAFLNCFLKIKNRKPILKPKGSSILIIAKINLIDNLVINEQTNSINIETNSKSNSCFRDALKIPGVFEVCLAYGCARSVILGILFWLPYYLESQNFNTKVYVLSFSFPKF